MLYNNNQCVNFLQHLQLKIIRGKQHFITNDFILFYIGALVHYNYIGLQDCPQTTSLGAPPFHTAFPPGCDSIK